LWVTWSRTEIEQRLAQHARGIDRADEGLLRESYHADGTVDYGSLQGTAAEFASAIAAMHVGAPMSSHRTSNIWIKVHRDTAVSESYVMAWVTLPTDGEPQPHLVGGRYLDRHSFKDDVWRMQHRHYVLDWIRQFPLSLPMPMQDALSLSHGCPRGAHYLQDPGNTLLITHASQKKSQSEDDQMNEVDRLDQVLSHQAITELGCRYARGVDRGDAEMVMSAFHDDAAIVSGLINGSARDFSEEIGVTIDKTLSCVAHTVTNHWIEVDGDVAVGESYVIAYQNTAGDTPEDVMTGGRYVDRYERRQGVWKIAHRTFVLDWTTSSPSKNLMDSGMFEGMTTGCRSQADPVYKLWADAP
jgi:ketosteroid isomerase-like protein